MTTNSERNMPLPDISSVNDIHDILMQSKSIGHQANQKLIHPYTRKDDIKMVAETDPFGLDNHVPGAKLDAGKQRPHLMLSGFANALSRIAEVTTKGAAKYTPNGWMAVSNGIERYQDAAYRHQLSLWQGEKVDQDTSCDHEAQVIWNLLASYELKLRKELESNVFKS